MSQVDELKTELKRLNAELAELEKECVATDTTDTRDYLSIKAQKALIRAAEQNFVQFSEMNNQISDEFSDIQQALAEMIAMDKNNNVEMFYAKNKANMTENLNQLFATITVQREKLQQNMPSTQNMLVKVEPVGRPASRNLSLSELVTSSTTGAGIQSRMGAVKAYVKSSSTQTILSRKSTASSSYGSASQIPNRSDYDKFIKEFFNPKKEDDDDNHE